MARRKKNEVRKKCRALAIVWKDDVGIAGILLDAADGASDDDAFDYLGDAISVLQRAKSGDLDEASVQFERALAMVNRSRR
jgi:hypothetical protein